jgi:hypothetical protein
MVKDVVITGTNLAEATRVDFLGTGVSATIVRSDFNSVIVDITIAANAPPGDRIFTVTTRTGDRAQSPSGVVFTVLPAGPTITSIAPKQGTASATQPVVVKDVVITGTNLAEAIAVTFSGTGVTAAIVPGGVTPTSVKVDIIIAPNAPPGDRTFTVTTRTGDIARSPSSVVFTVLPAGPTITSIAPKQGTVSATQSVMVKDVVITGTDLAGATAVTFSGTGVTATIVSSTPTSVKVKIKIAANAAAGARTFTVATPGGPADSGSVVFTVLPAVPTIRNWDLDQGQPIPYPGSTKVQTTIKGASLTGTTNVEVWKQAPSHIWVQKSGVETAGFTVASDTELRLVINIGLNATGGVFGVKVTTDHGVAEGWEPPNQGLVYIEFPPGG